MLYNETVNSFGEPMSLLEAKAKARLSSVLLLYAFI
jgi:hypothetical protein